MTLSASYPSSFLAALAVRQSRLHCIYDLGMYVVNPTYLPSLGQTYCEHTMGIQSYDIKLMNL